MTVFNSMFDLRRDGLLFGNNGTVRATAIESSADRDELEVAATSDDSLPEEPALAGAAT